MEVLVARRRGHACLPGRDDLALLLDGLDHIIRDEPKGIEFLWIQPDPHCIFGRAENLDVADARQTRELIHEIDRRVIAEIKGIIGAARRIERDDLQDRRRSFLHRHALSLHRRRQLGEGVRHAILDEHLGGIGIHADLEC